MNNTYNIADNKISLNIHIDVSNPKIFFALMRLVVKKLEELENSGIKVEYFELRLWQISNLGNNKRVYIKLDIPGTTFTDSDTSSSWYDAFINTYERIQDRFMNYEKDFPLSMNEKKEITMI